MISRDKLPFFFTLPTINRHEEEISHHHFQTSDYDVFSLTNKRKLKVVK